MLKTALNNLITAASYTLGISFTVLMVITAFCWLIDMPVQNAVILMLR